jgi:hypothetical protein
VQRRATTRLTGAALAVMLTGGLTACTGSSEDNGEDTKAGPSSSASPAPPGRYRTLPEPCGSVDVGTLKKLLPGAGAAESEGDGEESGKGSESSADASPFKGKAIVTYDTDRRAGCRWKGTNSLATRHLAVDFERVVSYDPAVSDDEQAQLLYDERAGQAEIPTESGPPADDGGEGSGGDEGDKASEQDESGAGDGSEADGKGGDSPGGSEKSDSDPAEPGEPQADSSPSPDADLSPRMLDDIGDSAYIDDKLDTADSGVHRDITLVFRSANVIATVKYDQWLTDKRRTPDSAELQEKARSVAENLAAEFDDN